MVYIVDDDPAIQQALERLMRSAGLRAETFASVLDLRTDRQDSSNGSYPYKKKLGLQEYEEAKHLLQIELLKMQ